MLVLTSGADHGLMLNNARAQEGSIPKAVLRLANASTVRIETPGEPGSGVVVRTDPSSCTLFTAYHVLAPLETGETGAVRFPGETKVELSREMVRKIELTDFAIVTLPSTCPTKHVAILANPNDIAIGDMVFVSGFSANVSPEVVNASYRVKAGRLLSLSEQRDGYSLTYSADTMTGMSGGPVFASNATLIGIHGRGETLGYTGQKVAAMGMSVRLARPSGRPARRESWPDGGTPSTRRQCPGVVC
jgi:S1-C subfamily serine protease